MMIHMCMLYLYIYMYLYTYTYICINMYIYIHEEVSIMWQIEQGTVPNLAIWEWLDLRSELRLENRPSENQIYFQVPSWTKDSKITTKCSWMSSTYFHCIKGWMLCMALHSISNFKWYCIDLAYLYIYRDLNVHRYLHIRISVYI